MVALMRETRMGWSLGAATLLLAVAAVLGGCASTPPGRDGPEANPPTGLARVPDAVPRIEPIRVGGPNKPYEVRGRRYVPITEDVPFTERGLASWYGRKFQGRHTANGEIYDMYAMTAAHPTLPLPSYARVRNPANGREVVVRVNDRGPFHPGRIIDLSYTAALKLGVLRNVSPVEVTRITFDDIRTGAWRRDGDGDAGAVLSAAREATPGASPGRIVSTDAVQPVAATPLDRSAGERLVGRAEAAPVTPLPAPAEPRAARSTDAEPAAGYWVQLGAYRQREGATEFRQRVAAELGWLAPLLGVFDDNALFRLQAGPYPSRDEASAVAERVRSALQLVPMIVERR